MAKNFKGLLYWVEDGLIGLLERSRKEVLGVCLYSRLKGKK